MIDRNKDFLKEKLHLRHQKDNFRSLKNHERLIDFSSNDYLGLAQNQKLKNIIHESWAQNPSLKNGSTGSRLISGTSKEIINLENKLADFFNAEKCLLFGSGYSANQTLLSCLGDKGDTIIYDQLAHVCLKEGAWLSKADAFSFRHNDLEHLENRLAEAKGVTFVVTESIFSMDGDFGEIGEILDLCERFGAHLIVDEAHSTGIYGNGAGWLAEQFDLERFFGVVYTFGKAIGCHGAAVVGSNDLIDYLVNFGRGFIYTTAPSPHQVLTIDKSLDFIQDHPEYAKTLHTHIHTFNSELKKQGLPIQSSTAIQPIFVEGNDTCKKVSSTLIDSGFDVRAILAPTVKSGEERLRISLHTHNLKEEIIRLVSLLQKAINS